MFEYTIDVFSRRYISCLLLLYDILKTGMTNWLSFTVIYVDDAEAKYKIVHVVMYLSTHLCSFDPSSHDELSLI